MEARTGRDHMPRSRRPPKSEKNLYRRGETYYARYEVNSVERRVSLFTSDRAVALKRLKPLLEVAKLERAGELPEETYAKAVTSWHAAGYGVTSESARKRYRVSLRMLDPHFGKLKLREITRRKIGEYVSARTEDGAKNATIRRDLTALSGLMRHCVSRGWRDDNPAKEWDRGTIKETRKPIQRVDARSYSACVENAPPVWASLLKFLLASGFRLEVDAAALRRDQIDWKAGVATFTTKGGRLRTRKLPAAAMEVLRALPHSTETDYLFFKPGQERMTELSSHFRAIRKRAMKQAKREGWTFKHFRLHDLRHEFAIRYLKHGGADGGVGSIYRLQGILGHTSVKTTEVYLDFLTDEEVALAKELASAQNPAQVLRFGSGEAS